MRWRKAASVKVGCHRVDIDADSWRDTHNFDRDRDRDGDSAPSTPRRRPGKRKP